MMQIRMTELLVIVAGTTLLAGVALGQEKSSTHPASGRFSGYDVAREVNLVGTVQSFTPSAQTAPLGAHVILQTGNGVVDVHLGDARLLAANHFTIQSGDILRIIGENVTFGNRTQFLARIVQKGTQVLQVRSVRGIPLSYMAARTGGQAKGQGGVR